MAALSRLSILPLALWAAPAGAEPLTLDLNALHPRDGACQMVLVAQNPGDIDLTQFAVEAVIFDPAGQVAVMTLLDLQDLPAARTRVRSFEIGGLDCGAVARVLLNAVSACAPASAPACAEPPLLSSHLPVEVLQ